LAFTEAGLPTFESPEDAIRAFGQLVEFRGNQELLTQTPAEPSSLPIDTTAAQSVIATALAAGRELLTEPEAKHVLAACGIPVVATRIVGDADGAVEAARALGFPVVLKILSPDLTHKSDVGGVQLGIGTEAELHEAATAMHRRIRQMRPGARIDGFTVQPMIDRPHAQELIVGASEDPVFGPIVLFGHGGTAVEAIADRAIGLPPLNGPLAADLVARTRVARLLAGYRHRPQADHDAICRTLVQIGQLMIDLPEVVELDINPLLSDENGVLALDARIRVAPARSRGTGRLAIMPYPADWEEVCAFDGTELVLRPIRPEDEYPHGRFLAQLRPDDVRFRFFGLVREFPHSQLARYTQIDYDREMAFIATRTTNDGEPEILGVVRVVIEPNRDRGEFAIVIRSDTKGRGLGRILLEKMIRYCCERGLETLHGQALSGNSRMLDLACQLGFTLGPPEQGVVELTLALGSGRGEA
jgi:acetyltransferase